MSALGSGPRLSLPADRPKLLWAGKTVFDVVLGAEHTGGAVALLEEQGERGDVTPMHVHRDEAEIFYVLEGGVTAWAGDDVHQLDAGSAVFLPAGQPHALGIRSERARVITITVPGGFADFVSAAGVSVTGSVPATWDFDEERILQAAPLHGIDIVGPPPPLD